MSDIIFNAYDRKKTKFFFEKCIDKLILMWYNKSVVKRDTKKI